jgi:hypothetical protein
MTQPTEANLDLEQVQLLPNFVHPVAARALGCVLLPSVLLNHDRHSPTDINPTSRLLDHNGNRMTSGLEGRLLTHIDDELPDDMGKVSVCRVRFMGLSAESGWHHDSKRDIRYVVDLLGAGELNRNGKPPIIMRPGDAVRVDNSTPRPENREAHNAISLSRLRVVLVYGRYCR